jgi:uncharacterized protein YecE (DUF72 family)
MDFGKLNDISEVNFKLPSEHILTKTVLTQNDSRKLCFVGPPIWSNKEWIGKIYPSNAKEKDFLYHYARQFNTIELNVTHYQIPSLSTVDRWKESVSGTHFRFCPKWPQVISHDRQLIGCEVLTKDFTGNISQLGDHLGMTFLQLSPYFMPNKGNVLEKFLRQLPANFPVAVEFRHSDWFSNKNSWQKTTELLRELNIGTVITDVAGRRDVLHQTLTIPTLTLRFVASLTQLHQSDYQRIKEWVQQIKTWFDEGLQTAYIFAHCHENNDAPELSKYWIETLNKYGNFDLQPPKIQPKIVQGSLF